MKLIDCQTHIFSPEFAELLFKNKGQVRPERQDGAVLVHFGNHQTLRIDPADYSPEKKLADMDRAGVEYSIIAPNIPGPSDLDYELKEPGARISNNYTAELCAGRPDRFRGLAVLPFTSIEATLSEYRRAIESLGLSGILLLSQLGGGMVDDPYWNPLYEAAASDGVPMVIHPTIPTWSEAIHDHAMIPMMGFMVDHSFAMLRLILGGVLERYPALKIVHPHCGGVLPYLIPRIDEQTEVKRRGRELITKAPSEYYKNVYMDIVSPSEKTIRFSIDFAGTDRMLFGSDHPWIKIESMVDSFKRLGLAVPEAEAVGFRNAMKLFRISS
ncbi:MAG: amidohydrolase family protein [bacterium]|jgi:predicted TIM-barrel fold metal-dependent hydrolase